MKLFYLIVICLIVNCGNATAQQLIADSIAKRCHVKSVMWQDSFGTANKFTRSYKENYGLNGKIIERITSENFYDTSRTFICEPRYQELFYYNGSGNLIKEQDLYLTFHTSKGDTTSFYTTLFSYNKKDKLIKNHAQMK